MNIEFITEEYVAQPEAIRYWFCVDGEDYGIHDCKGETSLLDIDGYPIDECNDPDGIKEALEVELDKIKAHNDATNAAEQNETTETD